jgi:hypothetical protein
MTSTHSQFARLFDERILLDDRFELAVCILHPDQVPAPTLH